MGERVGRGDRSMENVMKKFGSYMVVAALAAFGLSAPVAAQQPAAPGGIVILDSQRLVANAPGTSEASRALQTQIDSAQAEVSRMEATLDSLTTSYDQRQVMLSPEARRQLQEDIRARQREFQARAMELEGATAARQAELLGPIMSRIQTVVNALREERGYLLVLDAQEAGAISWSGTIDITDEVLARLRAAPQAPAGQ